MRWFWRALPFNVCCCFCTVFGCMLNRTDSVVVEHTKLNKSDYCLNVVDSARMNEYLVRNLNCLESVPRSETDTLLPGIVTLFTLNNTIWFAFSSLLCLIFSLYSSIWFGYLHFFFLLVIVNNFSSQLWCHSNAHSEHLTFSSCLLQLWNEKKTTIILTLFLFLFFSTNFDSSISHFTNSVLYAKVFFFRVCLEHVVLL